MKILLFVIVLFSELTYAGDLKGLVLNRKSKQPLEYVDVILKGSNLETITDSNGYFMIKDIPNGQYLLSIPTMLHEKYEEPLNFDSMISEYDLKILLEKVVPYVPRDSVIEQYHSNLNSFSPNELLEIKIDSIDANGSVYSTFENLSAFPIYVLRTIDCFSSCRVNIYSDKKEITPKVIRIADCVGMKTHPDSTDFIKISPHSEINYPAVKSYSSIPINGSNDYEVALTYNYKRPEKIYGPKFTYGAEAFYKIYKETFYYYNMAFRSEIKSKIIRYFN